MSNIIKEIQKKFGDESIMLLGEENIVNIDCVSTGSKAIDDILGGGLPKGRIIELYGPESSGKTTLALHAIAEVQKQGKRAAFIDAEHALDPVYAKQIGVKLDELVFSQPDSGEQALEIVERLISSNEFGIVVIDSVAALVPQAEINGEMGDVHVGLQARMMSQAMRKITGVANRSSTSTLFINQIREKVGVMFGSPETTPGGRALKFHASMRIEVRRGEKITNNGEVIGNKMKVKVVKNKIAPPFKETHASIIYGKGLDLIEEEVNYLLKEGVIEKSGSWYSYKGERICQGIEKVKEFLESNQIRDK